MNKLVKIVDNFMVLFIKRFVNSHKYRKNEWNNVKIGMFFAYFYEINVAAFYAYDLYD